MKTSVYWNATLFAGLAMARPADAATVTLTFEVAPPVPATLAETGSPAPDIRQPENMPQVAAANLLEQATFGPTGTEIARLCRMGATAWLREQFSLCASPVPVDRDPDAVRSDWHLNMANGRDQLRQRMIFALSEIFADPADKHPGGDDIQPWLASLSNHAFGNYRTLLREMILQAAAKEVMDDDDAHVREVMQSFTTGPVMLNQDGTVRLDRNGVPISTDNQTIIHDIARLLCVSTCPDKDLDAVLDTLFMHPNVPPFVATSLIRHFVTSDPSPAYVGRVAEAFAFGAGARGERGDLKATLLAILTDREARYDARNRQGGHGEDAILHTLSLVRAQDNAATDSGHLAFS